MSKYDRTNVGKLVLLLMFVGTSFAQWNGSCYQIGGYDYICANTSSYECMMEYSFQVVAVFEAPFIIATDSVQANEDYFNCYQALNAVNYSSQYITVAPVLTVQCDNDAEETQYLPDMSILETACGEEGYYYPPCIYSSAATTNQYNTITMMILGEMLGTYWFYNDLDDMFSEYQNCLMVMEAGEIYGIWICPAVVFDSCSHSARVTSYFGLQLEGTIIEGDSPPICIEFEYHGGISFCVEPIGFVISDNVVSGHFRCTFSDAQEDHVSYNYTMSHVSYTFPSCGSNRDECLNETLSDESSASTLQYSTNTEVTSENKNDLTILLGVGGFVGIILLCFVIFTTITFICCKRKVHSPYALTEEIELDSFDD